MSGNNQQHKGVDMNKRVILSAATVAAVIKSAKAFRAARGGLSRAITTAKTVLVSLGKSDFEAFSLRWSDLSVFAVRVFETEDYTYRPDGGFEIVIDLDGLIAALSSRKGSAVEVFERDGKINFTSDGGETYAALQEQMPVSEYVAGDAAEFPEAASVGESGARGGATVGGLQFRSGVKAADAIVGAGADKTFWDYKKFRAVGFRKNAMTATDGKRLTVFRASDFDAFGDDNAAWSTPLAACKIAAELLSDEIIRVAHNADEKTVVFSWFRYGFDQGRVVARDAEFNVLPLYESATAGINRDGEIEISFSSIRELSKAIRLVDESKSEGVEVEVHADLPRAIFFSSELVETKAVGLCVCGELEDDVKKNFSVTYLLSALKAVNYRPGQVKVILRPNCVVAEIKNGDASCLLCERQRKTIVE